MDLFLTVSRRDAISCCLQNMENFVSLILCCLSEQIRLICLALLELQGTMQLLVSVVSGWDVGFITLKVGLVARLTPKHHREYS